MVGGVRGALAGGVLWDASVTAGTNTADLVNNGTIPPTSAVTRLRGGRPLTPERSVNVSVGAVAGGGPFTLTAD